MKPIGERLAIVEEKHLSFERWNLDQNGKIQRIDDKLNLIQRWLMGVMGSVTIGLILTIINLVVK